MYRRAFRPHTYARPKPRYLWVGWGTTGAPYAAYDSVAVNTGSTVWQRIDFGQPEAGYTGQESMTLVRLRGMITQNAAGLFGVAFLVLPNDVTPGSGPLTQSQKDYVHVQYAAQGPDQGAYDLMIDGKGKRRLREDDVLYIGIENQSGANHTYTYAGRSLFLLGH